MAFCLGACPFLQLLFGAVHLCPDDLPDFGVTSDSCDRELKLLLVSANPFTVAWRATEMTPDSKYTLDSLFTEISVT